MASPVNIPYVQTVSTTTQLINSANTPQAIQHLVIEDLNKFTVDGDNGIITAQELGKYFYILTPQIGRVGVGQYVIPNFRCWVQKREDGTSNFVNVPNSEVLANVNIQRVTKDTLPNHGLITLEEGDSLRFLMTSNVSNEVRIESYGATTSEPKIPSVIISVWKLGKEDEEVV